jgi:threonine synthase
VPSNDHGSRGVSRASFANRAVSVSNRLDEIVQAIDLYG